MKIVINSSDDGLTESHVQEIRAVSEENEVTVARNQKERLESSSRRGCDVRILQPRSL